ADLDAGNVCGDRLEFASHFAGSVRLEIERILMGEAAAQVHHDDGTLRFGAGLRFGTQQLWQCEAAEGKTANFEEGTARDAVAESLARTEECQHGGASRRPVGDKVAAHGEGAAGGLVT